jgi:putative membrane protein
MGGADIIPGVSGGTVALILGIYERLVGAISRFDGTLIGLVRRRKWSAAAGHVDLRFLLALGVGILTGVAGLAKLMRYLLEHQQAYTLAAFFGLILASGLMVARMARAVPPAKNIPRIVLGVLAAAFAFWLVGQEFLQPQPGLLYTFFCGSVAICAMILPGISGAYILLLLGKYHGVTEIIDRLTRFDATTSDVIELAVLACGCAVGLLIFSKFLRWLLAAYHGLTMAVLCGFMLGSLRRIWPFQEDTTPSVDKFKEKVFEPVWPEAWDGRVTACLVIAIAAMAVVLIVDHFARRRFEQGERWA